MQGVTAFDDDEYLFGPSGTPVSDAETDIIRQRYEVWKLEGAGRDVMSLRNFAEQIYFGACPTPSDGVHANSGLDAGTKVTNSEVNDGDLYPNLAGKSSAPVGIAMTNLLAPESGPKPATVDGTGAMLLPALDRDLAGVGQVKLPMLERIATAAGPAKPVPALEAIPRSVQALDRATGARVAKPMPGLVSSSPMALPLLVRASSQRLPTLHLAPELASDTGDMLPLFRIPQNRRHRRAPGLASDSDTGDMLPLVRIPQNRRHRRRQHPETALLNSGVPTLRRIVQGPDTCPHITSDNAEFMAGSELSDIMAATRGIESRALWRGRAQVAVAVPTTVAAAASSSSARQLGPTQGFANRRFSAARRQPGGATSDSPRARARLQHAFAVVRDEFAEDPQQFAKSACGSGSSVVALAAELRGALAGVEAGDSKSAVAFGGLGSGPHCLLSDRRVRSAALDDPNGRRRAAFVSAASELADGLHARGYSDEARAILLGAESPPRVGAITDPFVRTMEEAWFRLMKQAQRGMGRDVTADTAISQAFVYFGTISSEITRIDRKTDPATAESRIMVWSAMAEIITMSSLTVGVVKASHVQGALPWMDTLASEIGLFSGMQTSTSEPAATTKAISQTLLTEPKIAGKVKKGLRIITKAALDAAVGSRVNAAKDATNVFMVKFLGKLKADDPAGRKSDFVRIYISAMCGVIFMRDIERNINSIHGLESLREKYVLQPMRAAQDYINSHRETFPFGSRGDIDIRK